MIFTHTCITSQLCVYIDNLNSLVCMKGRVDNMYGFHDYVNSGAFSGTNPTQFFIAHNPNIEKRLAELDDKTSRTVKNHLGEFHSEEEMERFIDHITCSERHFT